VRFERRFVPFEQVKRMYAQGCRKTTDERVTQIEEQLKTKIEQRSRAGGTGGVYVLRSAFKYFDTDQSGGLDMQVRQMSSPPD